MYKKQSKITEYFMSLKFIFCMYKMYPISAEGYKNAKVGIKIVRKTGHWQYERCWKWYGCQKHIWLSLKRNTWKKYSLKENPI